MTALSTYPNPTPEMVVQYRQQQQAQSSSSWTRTACKTLLFSGALIGAAYIGYRYGFFGVASKAVNAGYGKAIENTRKVFSKLPFSQSYINKFQNAVDSVKTLDPESVSNIVSELAKNDLVLNPRNIEWSILGMSFDVANVTKAVSDFYYNARNQALLFTGVGTFGASFGVLTFAKVSRMLLG